MTKIKEVNPKEFTPTIGAYSHGLIVPIGNANLILVTGQIALNKDGEVVSPNNPAEQAEFVFQNIKNILEEAGASMNNVIKSQIFLTNITDFQKISPIRNKYFQNSKPVSTMLEVSKLVKEGCCIEVEVIAIKYNNTKSI